MPELYELKFLIRNITKKCSKSARKFMNNVAIHNLRHEIKQMIFID